MGIFFLHVDKSTACSDFSINLQVLQNAELQNSPKKAIRRHEKYVSHNEGGYKSSEVWRWVAGRMVSDVSKGLLRLYSGVKQYKCLLL